MSVEIKYTDMGLADMLKRLEELRAEDAYVKFGWVEKNAMRADGRLSNADVAAINEFGTDDGRVPPRPTLRPSMDEHKSEYVEGLKWLTEGVLYGTRTYRMALNFIGKLAVKNLKAKIRSHVPPPNKESTIRKKGHGKTLIDTHQMLDSVSYHTNNGDGGKE
jgi:hypothetical protein